MLEKKSNWALHIYNALRMYQKNGTREFLAKHATPDLMKYIQVLAHQHDGSKLEEHCRKQLAAHADEVAAKKSRRIGKIRHQKRQRRLKKNLRLKLNLKLMK